MSGVPFDHIRDTALAQADRLLREWFPNGKRIGHEFKVGNLRGDVGDSLSISLTTGKWADFGRDPASGYDLIDLRAAMSCGGDRVAAARELGETLGISTPSSEPKPNGKASSKPNGAGNWRPIIPPPQGAPKPNKSIFSGFDTVYEYTSADDQLLHYVGRIEARGGESKKFVPIVYGALAGKLGWHKKHPIAPKPLYGLNRLATMPDATVLVCEGEKSADAAQELFPEYACVSWQGGTASVEYADLAPLQGRREIIVWPDNDSPGLAAAAKLHQKLPQSRVLRVDDMPAGGDAADLRADDPDAWLHEHQPAAEPDANATFSSRIINPADLEGRPIPEREWIVQDWLPIGCTTANYGDGGTGKTLLAQQLQTACATGTPWCGLAVMRCRSIGYYCEDDLSELQRRQAKINEHLGITFADLRDMWWISGVGEDNALITFTADGRMQVTKLFDDITQAITDFDPRLVTLDTAADLFAGNENDRHQVRQFISLLYRVEANRAVLLNAHPSRTGLNSGNLDGGSTAWNNSVRSRWSLARPVGEDDARPDTNERVLTRRKANYADIGDTIMLRWVNGILAPVTQQAGVLGSISRRAVEEVFLALLDRFKAEGRNVSESKNAPNYAPKAFAKRPESEGYTARDFDGAMTRLFAAGRIRVERSGRPGKWRDHIARCDANK